MEMLHVLSITPVIQCRTVTAGLVKVGMKRADVQKLMGAPTRSVGLKWYYGTDSGAMKIITFDSTQCRQH